MKDLIVLGAGMQGVAAAYDAATFGSFERIAIADSDVVRSIDASDRVNRLTGEVRCEPSRLDANDVTSLTRCLREFELVISAVPYKLHPLVEQVAVSVGCSVVDMGQDDHTALGIHARSEEAKERGVTIVTDCGLAPGLVNVFAAEMIAEFPDATSVRTYCGGLPEVPIPPLGYVLRFSMDSVIGEYSDPVLALRDGSVVTLEPLQEAESIEFPGMGALEAFTTSGGSGTAPYAFRDRIRDYSYKTLRYPGHLAAMKLFRDCGFWSESYNARIGTSPREAFSAIMEESLNRADIHDLVATRVEADLSTGRATIDMLERHDPQTGFTAMERLTGFSTSIVALEIANGSIGPGCLACESAVDPARFRHELKRRGILVPEPAAVSKV